MRTVTDSWPSRVLPGALGRAAMALVLAFVLPEPSFAQFDPSKLDPIFADWSKGASPGVVVGILRPDGSPPLIRAYGSANLEFGAPLSADSNFYICSVSKQFAAAAIALLAEDGKLSVKDEARKYVSELPQYPWPITIEHLIHHTSGLRDYLGVMALAGRSSQDFFAPSDILEIIARQEALNFEPGTEYSYSNSGYFLLAEIAARVSGMSLRKFSEERMFRPLGMSATLWDDDRSEVVPQRVVSYRRTADGSWRHFVKNFNSLGDGGVMSTATDMLKWGDALWRGGLGAANFRQTLRTRGHLNSGVEIPYAYGLVHATYRDHPLLEHGGGMLGFRTHLMQFQDDGLTIVILGNADFIDSAKMARQVADAVFGGDTKAAAPGPAPGDTYARWFGDYVDPKTDQLWVLKAGANNGVAWETDGRLFALRESGKQTLTSVDPMQPGASLVFAKNSVTLQREGEAPRELTRLEARKLDAAALSEYAGTYWSEPLGARYTIEVRNGELALRRKGAGDTVLRAAGPDRFANRMDFAFTRDVSGKVNGARAQITNLRHIPFRKE